MIAWMIYSVMVGMLFTAAALAADRVRRVLGRSSRLVWAAAVVATVAWPLAAPRVNVLSRAASSNEAGTPALLPVVFAEAASARTRGIIAKIPASVGPAAGVAWVLASLALLLRLGLALRAMRRRRREWAEREVNGVRVLVSDADGPAVVGVLRPEIVLPNWSLALEPQFRELVLRHEDEHRRAGDPLLLLGAAVAVALLPWNPAVWMQARRLRLAMEIDCDARVLRGSARSDRYGLLLITIAQRRLPQPALAAALVERTSHLERRITAMNALPTRRPRATAFALGAAAALAVAVACAADVPTPTGVAEQGRDAGAATLPADVYFEFQVDRQVGTRVPAVGPRYPAMLRTAGVEGEVLTQFVVGPDGVADMATFRVLRSTHELFTRAVHTAVADLRFHPAEKDGAKVSQLVQMPFVFSLTR